jgi:hypothetical protein
MWTATGRDWVPWNAAEAGIRQFLDIGTGLSAMQNTHEVAQAVAPESRVVHVDNDPLVLVHARALMAQTPAGAAPCTWTPKPSGSTRTAR